VARAKGIEPNRSALVHIACGGHLPPGVGRLDLLPGGDVPEGSAGFPQIGTLTSYAAISTPRDRHTVLGLVSHWLPERWYVATRESFVRMPAPAQGAALFCAALALREMASAEAVPFVYFSSDVGARSGGQAEAQKRKKKKAQRAAPEPPRSALDVKGVERPAFLLALHPELDRLVAAFEAGDYATVRSEAELADQTDDPQSATPRSSCGAASSPTR
jgi:hypothetical protein